MERPDPKPALQQLLEALREITSTPKGPKRERLVQELAARSDLVCFIPGIDRTYREGIQ